MILICLAINPVGSCSEMTVLLFRVIVASNNNNNNNTCIAWLAWSGVADPSAKREGLVIATLVLVAQYSLNEYWCVKSNRCSYLWCAWTTDFTE